MRYALLITVFVFTTIFSNAQNVGIGITNPDYPLTVQANNLNGGIVQKNGAVEIGFYTHPIVGAYLQTWTPHNLNFTTGNGTARMTLVHSTGYFGIGTTTPSVSLDVNGGFRLRGNGASTGKILGTDANGFASWQKDALSLPYAESAGIDDTLFAITTTGSKPSGYFGLNNTTTSAAALSARSNSLGSAFKANGIGEAGAAELYALREGPTLYVSNDNTENNGVGIEVAIRTDLDLTISPPIPDFMIFKKRNFVGPLATTQIMARINANGKGFFNGGTQTGGADLAEAFLPEGNKTDYEPGDVLSISTISDRTITKSSESYSTLVAGVYATKPGVLLTERMDKEADDELLPMGVVGVIPTKVCNEGGPIQRGDLLVTSSTLGYAMKGHPDKIKIGTVLGKALENFTGNLGLIKVLVNVK